MFGERLAEIRKERNLSQRKLAEMLGVSNTTIANYEKGFKKPNSDFITLAAKCLDISSDYLLGLINTRSDKFVDVGKITGLDDLAIDILEQSKKNTNSAAADIINTLVQSGAFIRLEQLVYEQYKNKNEDSKIYGENILNLTVQDIYNMSDEVKKAFLRRLYILCDLGFDELNNLQIEECINQIAQLLKNRYSERNV